MTEVETRGDGSLDKILLEQMRRKGKITRMLCRENWQFYAQIRSEEMIQIFPLEPFVYLLLMEK